MKKHELTSDIVVLYLAADSFPEGIQPAFDKLEDRLSSKNNRTFFGISWPDQQGKIHYKACAEEKYDGEGKIYGLDTFTIKKGTYISELLVDYKTNLPLIGTTFRQLLHHPELDTNSYCLEWYKGNDVLCLVKLDPLKKE
jgi:hypothetical protein